MSKYPPYRRLYSTPLESDHAVDDGKSDGNSDDGENEAHFQLDRLFGNLLDEEEKGEVGVCQSLFKQRACRRGHLRESLDSYHGLDFQSGS